MLTGYLLGFASGIPLTGWASNRFGAKPVWIGALVLFLAGSALAGAAWSIESLIAFWALQGIGLTVNRWRAAHPVWAARHRHAVRLCAARPWPPAA